LNWRSTASRPRLLNDGPARLKCKSNRDLFQLHAFSDGL